MATALSPEEIDFFKAEYARQAAAAERSSGQAVLSSEEVRDITQATAIETGEREAVQAAQPRGAMRGVAGLGRGIDNLWKGMQQLYGYAAGDEKLLSDVKFQRDREDDVYKYGGRVPLGTMEGQRFAEIVGETIPFLAMPVKIPGMGMASTVLGKAAVGTAGLGLEALVSAGQAALPYAGDPEERRGRMEQAAALGPVMRVGTSALGRTGAAARIEPRPGGPLSGQPPIPTRMKGEAGEIVAQGAAEGIPIGRGRLHQQMTAAEAAAGRRTTDRDLGNSIWNLDAAVGTSKGKAFRTMMDRNDPGKTQAMYRNLDDEGKATFKEAYYTNALDKATKSGTEAFSPIKYAQALKTNMAGMEAANVPMAKEMQAFGDLMTYISREGKGPSRDVLQNVRGFPFIYRAVTDTIRESNIAFRLKNADPRVFSETLEKIGATPEFQEQLVRNFIRSIGVGEAITRESGEDSFIGDVMSPTMDLLEYSEGGLEEWRKTPGRMWNQMGGSRSKGGK